MNNIPAKYQGEEMDKISKEEKETILDYFGLNFNEKILINIEKYSEKWKLKEFELVNCFSVNCILKCYSKKYGNAVLKISRSSKELISEFNTLQEYKGRGFCSVFEADIENSVMLLERIIPGESLRDEKILNKRLEKFSQLYNELHIEYSGINTYPSYFNWVIKITEYMSKRDDHKELYFYMKKAENLCRGINNLYKRNMLLHGDFHHDNILLSEGGKYKIIDPKGVTGDPVFDISRFILNEVEENISMKDNFQKIHNIISFLEKSTGIPRHIIGNCFFIETAMANCWNVESNLMPDIEMVKMAQAFLNFNV